MFDSVENVASFDSVTAGTSSSPNTRIGLTYTESNSVTKDQSSDAIPIAGLDEQCPETGAFQCLSLVNTFNALITVTGVVANPPLPGLKLKGISEQFHSFDEALQLISWHEILMLDNRTMKKSAFIERYEADGSLHQTPYTNNSRVSLARGSLTGPTSLLPRQRRPDADATVSYQNTIFNIKAPGLARTIDSVPDGSLVVPVNRNRESGDTMSQALGVLSLSSLTSKKSNFNVFQKLPIEIRLKIWKLSELDPRLIVFNCGVNRRTQVTPFQGEPLLAVCHESRSEARKTYKLYHWKGSPQRYLRPDVDIFYFPEVGLQGSEKAISVLQLIGHSDMRHMKHLALDLSLWLDFRQTFSDTKHRSDLWLPLLQLERVIMVIKGGAIEKQEGDTPEENPRLNFLRMDTIIEIRFPQLPMKNKEGILALKTFRQWVEKDFKNTSRQHRKWKTPRLEFKMLLDGEHFLRGINEYEVLEEESGYAGDREDN